MIHLIFVMVLVKPEHMLDNDHSEDLEVDGNEEGVDDENDDEHSHRQLLWDYSRDQVQAVGNWGEDPRRNNVGAGS